MRTLEAHANEIQNLLASIPRIFPENDDHSLQAKRRREQFKQALKSFDSFARRYLKPEQAEQAEFKNFVKSVQELEQYLDLNNPDAFWHNLFSSVEEFDEKLRELNDRFTDIFFRSSPVWPDNFASLEDFYYFLQVLKRFHWDNKILTTITELNNEASQFIAAPGVYISPESSAVKDARIRLEGVCRSTTIKLTHFVNIEEFTRFMEVAYTKDIFDPWKDEENLDKVFRAIAKNMVYEAALYSRVKICISCFYELVGIEEAPRDAASIIITKPLKSVYARQSSPGVELTSFVKETNAALLLTRSISNALIKSKNTTALLQGGSTARGYLELLESLNEKARLIEQVSNDREYYYPQKLLDALNKLKNLADAMTPPYFYDFLEPLQTVEICLRGIHELLNKQLASIESASEAELSNNLKEGRFVLGTDASADAKSEPDFFPITGISQGHLLLIEGASELFSPDKVNELLPPERLPQSFAQRWMSIQLVNADFIPPAVASSGAGSADVVISTGDAIRQQLLQKLFSDVRTEAEAVIAYAISVPEGEMKVNIPGLTEAQNAVLSSEREIGLALKQLIKGGEGYEVTIEQLTKGIDIIDGFSCGTDMVIPVEMVRKDIPLVQQLDGLVRNYFRILLSFAREIPDRNKQMLIPVFPVYDELGAVNEKAAVHLAVMALMVFRNAFVGDARMGESLINQLNIKLILPAPIANDLKGKLIRLVEQEWTSLARDALLEGLSEDMRKAITQIGLEGHNLEWEWQRRYLDNWRHFLGAERSGRRTHYAVNKTEESEALAITVVVNAFGIADYESYAKRSNDQTVYRNLQNLKGLWDDKAGSSAEMPVQKIIRIFEAYANSWSLGKHFKEIAGHFVECLKADWAKALSEKDKEGSTFDQSPTVFSANILEKRLMALFRLMLATYAAKKPYSVDKLIKGEFFMSLIFALRSLAPYIELEKRNLARPAAAHMPEGNPDEAALSQHYAIKLAQFRQEPSRNSPTKLMGVARTRSRSKSPHVPQGNPPVLHPETVTSMAHQGLRRGLVGGPPQTSPEGDFTPLEMGLSGIGHPGDALKGEGDMNASSRQVLNRLGCSERANERDHHKDLDLAALDASQAEHGITPDSALSKRGRSNSAVVGMASFMPPPSGHSAAAPETEEGHEPGGPAKPNA